MAVSHGYSSIATSGSIFMYDIGDTFNSFKGEPTTNIWGIVNGSSVNNRSGWDMPYAYNGSITNTVYSSTWNGNRIWEVLHTQGTSGYAGFESWRLCVDQPTASPNTYSSTRRVAIKICVLEGSITDMALHTGGGNSSHNSSNWTSIPPSQVPADCPQKTGWYQFLADASWSSTTVGHCVGLGFITYNRVRILTTEPMYYPSDHLIPFTGYIRSSTGSLFDISGYGRSMNVSNMSFTSTAQPTFDGTDDFLNVSSNFGTLSQYTVEHVSYYQTVNRMPIASVAPPLFYHYGDNSWYYTHGGVAGEYYYPKTVTINGWGHWTITYDGSFVKIYRNGVYEGQQATTGTADWTNGLKIGNYTYGGYPWNGQIAVVKFYNRALTTNEILQNFNHYKTRFNII